MLNRNLARVYRKCKMSLYARVMKSFADDREDALSAMEVICMELIVALEEPTVNEFARYASLSAPNAAYKVGRLVKKGYLEKVRSEKDHREYHLRPTEKYDLEYGEVFGYTDEVSRKLREKFSQEDLAKFDVMLRYVGNLVMPDANSVRDLK